MSTPLEIEAAVAAVVKSQSTLLGNQVEWNLKHDGA
jgi:hypothetical protein